MITQTKKLICDWSNKKNYLVHYRMLKFYIRHGMLVEKVHSVISYKQIRWLEKIICLNTQKRNQAVNDFEKDFYKLLQNAFYGKTKENFRNRLKIKPIKKDDYKEIIKQQSKITLMVFINHMRIVKSILLNKMKFLWINLYT